MHILVIEDDAIITRSIELMLRSDGHDCDIASSGEEGINHGELQHYDVIVLDLMLPDMEGYEVVRRLRAAMVATPILILSGLAELDSKVKGLSVGADDYLTKPFDRDELIARIQALVRRSMGYSTAPEAGATPGSLLAAKGQAAPWNFNMAYTPYGEDGEAPDDDSAAAGPQPAIEPRQRRVIKFAAGSDVIDDPEDDVIAAPEPWEEEPAPEVAEAAAPQEQPAPETVEAAAAQEQPAAEAGEAAPQERAAPNGRQAGGGRVIVLGNEKGGTGKSTTAMHLIVALLRDGHTVASVDLDSRQGTLTHYIENRAGFAADKGLDLPMPARHVGDLADATAEELEKVLEQCIAACEYVVVDTPGSDSALSRVAHEWADTLIAPINDSLVDLDVFARIERESLEIQGPSHYADMVLEAKKLKAERTGEPIDWIVLRNRLSAIHARNKENVADVLAQLSKLIGFRQGPGLSERVIYRELFLSGLTLLDLRDRGVDVEFTMSHVAARQELRALLQAVRPADSGTDEHDPTSVAA
jgi:chromosome partitioning protein